MDKNNRPVHREKNVSGQGSGAFRRGEGQGTGPVGSGSAFSSGQQQPPSGTGGKRSGGTRSFPTLLIVLAAALLLGTGGLSGLSSLFTGMTEQSYSDSVPSDYSEQSPSGSGFNDALANLLPSAGSYAPSVSFPVSGSSGWSAEKNTGKLDRSVAEGAREKYTVLKGDGEDTVTIMVYLCGADLESRSAMATRDLSEMTKATLSDKVNLLVYAGGTTRWQNSIMSNRVNQIYQIKGGGLVALSEDAGSASMTEPDTLIDFIEFSARRYPADRYELILWDHGGGSLSGYGYDERHTRTGSMSLSGIDRALTESGVKFDFIGFDACLMATVENAAMLAKHADYLIASEETEPGIGWYYTNWLTALSQNTSMPTLDIGKNIVDDFVSACAQSCPGQATTLSVIDLSELGETLPERFSAFSRSLREQISSGEYQTVSQARSDSREFAASSAIDQIDFVDFIERMDAGAEGEALAKTLLSSVKYNRCSSSMTNAYGLSVYFPLKKMSKVDTAVKTYDELGLDADFSGAIREFASMELSGQAVSGGSNSALSSLLGQGQSYAGGQNAAQLNELLTGLLGGSFGDLGSLEGIASSFFAERSLEQVQREADYLAEHSFDASALTWQQNAAGEPVIALSEEQWALIHNVDLNLFYDDGHGYMDLGLDNIFSFDDEGNLVADTSGTWLSINDQPVAYYHSSTLGTQDDYTITGYVPALLNGERVNLILIFTSERPEGFIAGAQPVYDEDETLTVARGLIELQAGDRLDFLCDFYSYDGVFQDSYMLGSSMTVTADMRITDTYLGEGGTRILYRFTDLYDQHYWTESITK